LEHLYKTKETRQPGVVEKRHATGPGRKGKTLMKNELKFVAFFV
jgi:hypothetical protein